LCSSHRGISLINFFRPSANIALLLYLRSSTQTGENCWSHHWGLIGRAHLIALQHRRPGVTSFNGFLEMTCRLAVCTYTSIRWEARSVCMESHLV